MEQGRDAESAPMNIHSMNPYVLLLLSLHAAFEVTSGLFERLSQRTSITGAQGSRGQMQQSGAD